MRLPGVPNSDRAGGSTLGNDSEGPGESGSAVFVGEPPEGPASVPGLVEFEGVVMLLMAKGTEQNATMYSTEQKATKYEVYSKGVRYGRLKLSEPFSKALTSNLVYNFLCAKGTASYFYYSS